MIRVTVATLTATTTASDVNRVADEGLPAEVHQLQPRNNTPHDVQQEDNVTPDDYTTIHATPSIEVYRHLRQMAGLTPKTLEAASRGLPNSLFAVQIMHAGETVAMGRVIGDGGAFYQVVDIAVLPSHRGRGLGKKIMGEIQAYLQREVPASGYVSLLADGEAYRLYQQFGFALTAPATVGMALMKADSPHPSFLSNNPPG